MASLKVAIIGSGASAVGVLSGLESSGADADVTMYSSDKYASFSLEGRYAEADVARFYDEVYAKIRSQSVQYPPRKTFFGDTVPCYFVNNEERFFISDMFGGQTNVWGGLALPFTEEDFTGWPITRIELDPHYRAIADLIGIAGHSDRVSDFLGAEYSNTPPIKQLHGFGMLGQYLNGHAETDEYRFHAGISRNAVDTRKESPSSCIHCGECMAGCLRDAVYSTRNTLKKYIDRGKVRFIRNNVREIHMNGALPEIHTADNRKEVFDKIFLCAGCISTAKILMRSLRIQHVPDLQDNVIYQFPVMNLSSHSDSRKEEYFGMTNLVVLIEPKREGLPFLQAQLYPNVDYLWRTLVPQWSWSIVRHPVRWLRDRVIWARLYMDSADSYHYSMHLENDRPVFREEHIPDRKNLATVLKSMRRALRGSMYFVPPVKPKLAHTSGHLSSTFPYGGEIVHVARDGQVMPHVHISDSSCFPRSPVLSPTLTIMANARRTALEALRS